MENVSKSKPLSVKFPPETRLRMKSICKMLGKSENALVNEAMESIIRMIDQQGQQSLPKLVVLAQAARRYEDNPPGIAVAEAPPVDGRLNDGITSSSS